MSNFVASRSVPFVTRVAGRHAKDIIARDRARAQKIMQCINPHGPVAFHELRRRRHHGHHGHGHGVDVTDAGVTYTASVGVGNPATQYTLLIDTGSSNTWVGADKPYRPTSSSKSTGQRVSVSYGSGSFSGTEYTDTVSLSSSLVIENQSIGVASTAQGFQGVDGILGIGPVDLTVGTVGGNTPVPTVTDNLFAQGLIQNDSIGIFYQPTTQSGAQNGELTFGGVDTSKITGDVSFVPITSTQPASMYWGIDQDLTYGNNTSLLSGSAGIVDTGTTLLLLATDAFQAYQRATGATMDNATGLLTLTEQQFANLQSLFFTIGGTTFEFTPNAQIWPRALNSTIGGEEGKIYLVAADLGSPSGQGLDFINGFAFLQRFYSVYDTGNSQVGLATTPFTTAETN
ncbi:acid protease [Trametes cingulata]|nr:acid protease [Trametes cingulata]